MSHVWIAVWDCQNADKGVVNCDGGPSFLLLAPDEHEMGKKCMEIGF
jgi:hypothetical protein